MFVRMECCPHPSLPPLAWCARLERKSPVVIVSHGLSVETGERFFVEGVWDGSFAAGGFDQSCLLMGSGGRIVGGRVVLATPCHMLERVHLARIGDVLFASNSLPFVLAAAGLHLDPGYPDYIIDLWSMVHGPDRCVKSLPTQATARVRLCYFGNVEVDDDLQVVEREKPWPREWNSFGDYRRFLSDGAAALARNAVDEQRRRPFGFVASISSGYDSPASAVLAEEVGCRLAVTFREGVRYLDDNAVVDDSGARIARLLGMEVHEYSSDFDSGSFPLLAAEFAACADAFDLKLGLFEPELAQKLLFTGLGGGIWARREKPLAGLLRQYPTGASLAEFRMRVGFVHVPVPYFGAARYPAFHAICNSSEMRPWTLGTDYDKPIARRILEERGIPRELFGQSKKGSFAILRNGRSLSYHIEAFEEYRRRYEGARLGRAWLEARHWIGRARLKWNRIADRFGIPRLLPSLVRSDVPLPGDASLLVPWGNSVLEARYRNACPEAGSGSGHSLTPRVGEQHASGSVPGGGI